MVLIALSLYAGCDNVIICFIPSFLKYLSISVPKLQAPSLSEQTTLGFPTLLNTVFIASNISGIVLDFIGIIVINLLKISIAKIPPTNSSFGKSDGFKKSKSI